MQKNTLKKARQAAVRIRKIIRTTACLSLPALAAVTKTFKVINDGNRDEPPLIKMHDHEIALEQDDIPDICGEVHQESLEHEYGWEMEHIEDQVGKDLHPLQKNAIRIILLQNQAKVISQIEQNLNEGWYARIEEKLQHIKNITYHNMQEETIEFSVDGENFQYYFLSDVLFHNYKKIDHHFYAFVEEYSEELPKQLKKDLKAWWAARCL